MFFTVYLVVPVIIVQGGIFHDPLCLFKVNDKFFYQQPYRQMVLCFVVSILQR